MSRNLSFHDQQHIQRMLLYERRVNNLYNALIRSVSEELKKWKYTENSNVWVRNAEIERKIDRLLAEFESELEKLIKDGQLESWRLSNEKNDNLVSQYIRGLAVNDLVRNGMFLQNMSAFTAFQNRVENGLTLSQRVWNITDQTKKNFELYLKSGIAAGRSAAGISRDIRQLLNDPDKRFRRVRDKNGKLVPSQPMKNYHPGQGKYRSAYKNALRTAATEINRAYRTADLERWRQLDFVLGYEVRRSPRVTEPCKICDPLVGRYPKDFSFVGWHPFCICIAVSIRMNDKDFAEYLRTGKVPPGKHITDIPKSAKDFFANNPKFVENSMVGKLNFEVGNVNKPIFGSRQNVENLTWQEKITMPPKEASARVKAELIGKTIELPNTGSRTTGILQLNSKGLKDFLSWNHSPSSESKWILHEMYKNPQRIRYDSFYPLDRSRANIQNKIATGFTGYNHYFFNHRGQTWRIGMAIIKDEYERPYFITKVR